MTQSNYQALVEKWGPILEHDSFSPIADQHKRSVTATILENTEKALMESGDTQVGMSSFLSEAAPTNAAGSSPGAGFSSGATAAGPVAGYDPILISLVRRAMPNLMAYDIAGVQPMTGPTGLIFAMRSHYTNQTGDEAFYNEAATGFSGAGASAGTVGSAASANTGTGMTTAAAEALGDGVGAAFAEMAFSIEKVAVTAKSRALKAEYTTELAQDLKAVHGLDAETELANILQSEILVEINRELVRTIYTTAKSGAAATATPGTFDLDVDANGRWSVEKFKGLMFQIEQEANAIAKGTRRGKGNMVICSSDVASALQMAGVLDYTPALNGNNLAVDDTGNTFAGVLNGRYRVYIDPYAGSNYLVVGYKGSSAFDAGLFYCPYVPLQMVRAVGENSFQPKIGFKTRYGMVANPYAEGDHDSQGLGALTANTNQYYRRVLVSNLF
ncbi:MAG: ATP-binding protein [Hellea sp.]|nr:ATP-binding protein [Hellea sp.]